MRLPKRSRFPSSVNLVPALVAGYPAAFVAGSNPGETPLVDVALTLVVFCAMGALVHAATSRAAPPRIHATVVGVMAAVLNAILFCSVLLAERIPGLRLRYTLAIVVIGGAATLWYLWRVGGERRGASRAVALVTLAAYATVGYAALDARRVRADASRRLESIRSLRAPLSAAARPSSRPDIYLLLLDNYASTDVLRARFGFRNDTLLDSLRALGFETPVTRSNYAHTAHSLASMLNLGYLDSLGEAARARSTAPLYALIRDDRTTALLERLGYRTYLVPSLGWGGTRVHGRARVHLETQDVGVVRGTVARAELLPVSWRRTLMGQLAPELLTPDRARTALMAFDGVRDLIDEPGPKFVLAHSLATHAPFLHDERCRPRDAKLLSRASEDDADPEAYVDAIRCTNAHVLALVTEIVERSNGGSVVLLQSDHGPRSLGAPLDGPAERITPAQAAERFGAFGSYHIPGGSRVAGDTVTPVNLFRGLLAHLFGTATPPLPDRHFYNTATRPFDFHEIAPAVLALPADSGPRAVRATGAY